MPNKNPKPEKTKSSKKKVTRVSVGEGVDKMEPSHLQAGRAAAMEARLAAAQQVTPDPAIAPGGNPKEPPREPDSVRSLLLCRGRGVLEGGREPGLGATRPPSPSRRWVLVHSWRTTVSVSGRRAVAAGIVHSHTLSVLENEWKPRAHRLCARDREPWSGERPQAAGPPRSVPTQTPGQAAAPLGSKHLPSQAWRLG